MNEQRRIGFWTIFFAVFWGILMAESLMWTIKTLDESWKEVRRQEREQKGQQH